ncbi:MAG: hypothetical protein K0R65_1023 [Crocinitomicaceae bacterium]|jgi:hypothetical protein|nr:hypothetical protein [Crocinitomicaceae bacterium]
MFKSKYTFLLVSAGLSLVSCGGNEDKDGKTAKVVVETDNNFNSEEYDFVLPQPISLAKAFQAAGLKYTPGATNPASNKQNYQSKVKQLLNLGVYSTDLAYSAINEKSQEAREYLKAIQELGNGVGLKPVFSDKKIIEKFDKNLNNMEVIEDLIYDIQERSEEYMDDNDIRYLSVVQFAGAWVEGMYLGIKDIEQNPDSNLPVTIVDQINLLKNIVKGLKTYPTSDEVLSNVIKKLEDIQATYDNFASVKTAMESSTFVSPKLTPEEFRNLAAKIKDLRTYIVK